MNQEKLIKVGLLVAKVVAIGAGTIVSAWVHGKVQGSAKDIGNGIERTVKTYIEKEQEN